jgi:2-desacetyl-2-hydroxyethyl bacteriochlorophyllide A dehydrogenase
MKTIVLDKPGAFRLVSTQPPGRPGPGEALVRVRRVGICGTDLHAFKGEQPFFEYPRILGHELGVEVVELGPQITDLPLTTGDLCSVEPYMNCGRCLACRRGQTNCCEKLRVLGVHTDGGMREYLVVPADKLLPSTNVPVDHLALVEMLCIGAHATRRAAPEPDENVLVIGAGPIGLSAIQFAKLTGANVMVMEMSDNRLEFCQRNLGIETAIDAKGDALAQIREALNGDLPTIVFDATGSPRSMMGAFQYVANGSKLVFVGLFQGDVTFNDPEFHRREMTLMSSRNATRADFNQVLAHLEAGDINLTPWITHRASPEELVDQFASWTDPNAGVVKAMLEI